MTKRTTGDDASPDLPVPAGGDPASMDDWAARLVDQARAEGIALIAEKGRPGESRTGAGALAQPFLSQPARARWAA